MLSYRYRPEVIEARLCAFERDPQLFAAGNLAARAVALDAIQQVCQFLHLFPRDTPWGRYRQSLTQQAKALEHRLRQADADWFHTLRQQIRTGQHSAQLCGRCLIVTPAIGPAAQRKCTEATMLSMPSPTASCGRTPLPPRQTAEISR